MRSRSLASLVGSEVGALRSIGSVRGGVVTGGGGGGGGDIGGKGGWNAGEAGDLEMAEWDVI